MNYKKQLGEKGEFLAINWLKKKGFTILYKNFRHGKIEIDILARKENTLYIIEVKTRKSKAYGYPEESVNTKKIDNMKTVAELFQDKYSAFLFCIMAISIHSEKKIDVFFIEDVY